MSVTSTGNPAPRAVRPTTGTAPATAPTTAAAPALVPTANAAAPVVDADIAAAPTAAQANTYYSPKFFKGSIVRDLIKEHDRRVSPEFLALLDAHIKDTVTKACQTFIGNKKTLDEAVAVEIGIAPRPQS
jgi:type V secretory pathway adhesin AidA